MTKPMVNRKKGEHAVELDGQWIVLKASFGNISLFESNVMGIYEFADNLSQGKVKMTDIVNVIYCFQQDRNNGLDQDTIAEMIINDEPQKAIEAIAGFMGILFGVDDLEVSEKSPEPDKKK